MQVTALTTFVQSYLSAQALPLLDKVWAGSTLLPLLVQRLLLLACCFAAETGYIRYLFPSKTDQQKAFFFASYVLHS